MAVQPFPTSSAQEARTRIVDLVGSAQHLNREPARLSDTPAILALQMQAIDNFVEMIRLRTQLAERDRRIASLSDGLRVWRERAGTEQAERRREAREAQEREREIVSLLHQQMQVADAATTELERYRALPWWRRLRA